MMTSQPIVCTTICTGVCVCLFLCLCTCMHLAYFVCHVCMWLSPHVKSDKLRRVTEIPKRHASDILQDYICGTSSNAFDYIIQLNRQTKNSMQNMF